MPSTQSDYYTTLSTTFSSDTLPITQSEIKHLLTDKKLWNFDESEARHLDEYFENLFEKGEVDRLQFENTLRNTRSTGVVRYPFWHTNETKISVKKVSDQSYLVEVQGTNFGNRFFRAYLCSNLKSVKSLKYKELQYA
jgi:hypothetical protein